MARAPSPLKDYKDVVFYLEDVTREHYDVVPTGAPPLDEALGIGGWPRGRISEVWGAEGAGKSTLVLHSCAEAQRSGLEAAYVDAEHSLDGRRAAQLGIDPKRLVVVQPEHGEQALDATRALIETGDYGLVVVDSVAGLIPKAILHGDLDDGSGGLGQHARMMARAMTLLVHAADKANTALVFVNQERSTIPRGGYGATKTTTGGVALRYFASVRVALYREEDIKDGAIIIGQRVKGYVKKNKCSEPCRAGEWDLIFSRGISLGGIILDRAIKAGVVSQKGSYFEFEQEKLGQGRFRVALRLDNEPELRQRIEALLKQSTDGQA